MLNSAKKTKDSDGSILFFIAVKGIKKQHLVEVRTMGNPPPVIKLALESICLLLGQPVADWKEIRQILMKDTFISSIVNFDTDDITYVLVILY